MSHREEFDVVVDMVRDYYLHIINISRILMTVTTPEDTKAYELKAVIPYAEVLFCLFGRDVSYTREFISERLYLDIQKVSEAARYLTRRNLIRKDRQAYRSNISFGSSECWDTETGWALRSELCYATEWYGDLDINYRPFIRFIHCICNYEGFIIKDPSRRMLAIAYVQACEASELVSSHTLRNMRKDLAAISLTKLSNAYVKDHYDQDVDAMAVARSAYYSRLVLLNKCHYYMEHPKAKKRRSDSDEVFNVACEARTLFPKPDDDRYRNAYIYEYFVNQPGRSDTEFPSRSRFYGKPLEERRELLKDRKSLSTIRNTIFDKRKW